MIFGAPYLRRWSPKVVHLAVSYVKNNKTKSFSQNNIQHKQMCIMCLLNKAGACFEQIKFQKYWSELPRDNNKDVFKNR